ncbi:MAG: lipid A export permease/ATP-binding protein MsbA [Gammaproteobacteria bacterium]
MSTNSRSDSITAQSNYLTGRALYQRLLKYLKPYWKLFFIGLAGSACYSAIDSAITYSLKPLLDKGFIARDLWYIQWIPVIIICGFLIRAIAGFISDYCMTWIARTLVMVLRQDLFKHFAHLPTQFYDNTSSGQLLSKMLFDVGQISKASTDSIANMVQSACFIIGLLVVMLVISWKLALLYFVLAPVVAFIVRYSSKRIRRISHDLQAAMRNVTEIAEESFESARVVKIFGGQQYEINKFNSANRKARHRDMKVAITKSWTVSGVQLIAALGIAGIIAIAISPKLGTMMSAGSFVSFNIAMLALLRPLKVITSLNSTIQLGLAGAQSVFALLDQPLERNTGTVTVPRVRGDIVYQHVSFRYQADQTDVLHDINLHIKPGKTLALVGRSGSGKSTIASLLARFYDITHGKILIDGIALQDFELNNLRQQIALVTQDVSLFNDTVRNNIAYGCVANASEADIIQAAEAAYAMKFIRDLPQGLDTVVGENGVLLSGGQRQRLAIARALLKDAPILILDEATSALDTESERYIQAALDNVMQNRTTLVIAHRLSTIEQADHIVVLEHGHIVEQGNHSELIARKGAYAKLHAMQFNETQPAVMSPSTTSAINSSQLTNSLTLADDNV